MKINILHVVGSLDIGGSQTLLLNILKKIDKEKFHFGFVVNEGCDYALSGEIEKLGGEIFYLPRYRGTNHFEYVARWNAFFKKHPEYKIVHGHVRSTASIYLHIAKKYGCFAIAHSHNTSSGNGLSASIKNLFQLPIRFIADYFIACSEEAGRWLFGKRVTVDNRFHVLKNGIDIDEFIFSEESRIEIRDEFGVNGKFVVGNVARFHEQKNHDFLIDVFYEIHKKLPESVLLLVGDGELKGKMIEKVNSMNMNDCVIFAGTRTDISRILSGIDIFCFPSLYEGLGIVAIEAQSAGLFVICSDGVPSEVKVTNSVEFVSLNENAEIWANKILAYKNNVERTCPKLEITKSGYNIRDSVNWLESLYQDINNRKI